MIWSSQNLTRFAQLSFSNDVRSVACFYTKINAFSLEAIKKKFSCYPDEMNSRKLAVFLDVRFLTIWNFGHFIKYIFWAINACLLVWGNQFYNPGGQKCTLVGQTLNVHIIFYYSDQLHWQHLINFGSSS